MLLVCFISVGATFCLTSCGDNSSSKNNSESQYKTLTNAEQEVYRVVCNKLDDFVNPESVKVTKVSKTMVIGGRYLEITAKNSYGYSVSETYQIMGSTLKSADFDISHDEEINVSNINFNLNIFKREVGYI